MPVFTPVFNNELCVMSRKTRCVILITDPVKTLFSSGLFLFLQEVYHKNGKKGTNEWFKCKYTECVSVCVTRLCSVVRRRRTLSSSPARRVLLLHSELSFILLCFILFVHVLTLSSRTGVEPDVFLSYSLFVFSSVGLRQSYKKSFKKKTKKQTKTILRFPCDRF